jgi:hypothetical protein
MRHPLSLVLVGCTLVALGQPLASFAFDITSCDQLVPDHQVGTLQADVMCVPGEGIALGRSATLQLNGHTVSTDADISFGMVGIACLRGTCRVDGPGEVSGFGGASAHDNSVGILGGRVQLFDVHLEGNSEWGASGDKLQATNVTASGNNGEGLLGNSLKLTDVVTSGNVRDGVRCSSVTARRLTATDNLGFGIQSVYPGRTKVVDSVVTGNGIGYADVGSQRRPNLKGTTCGTSHRLSDAGGYLGTWGLCTAD